MNDITHRDFGLKAGSVERSLVAAVERSALRKAPFDHIYMEQVLPPDEYQAVIAALPERRFFHELSHLDAMRADGTSTRLRLYLYPELLKKLPEAQRRVWMPIGEAFCSRRLREAFKVKFRDVLETRFRKPIGRIGIYPIPVLLRDQPGYRIGIHADVLTKAITAQFYLPANNWQRHIGTIFHEGERGEAARKIVQMPFLPATGYAFPVSLEESWHSAATTTEEDGERVSMMVTYYITDSAFTWLKYRLRRVALRFGIRPPG